MTLNAPPNGRIDPLPARPNIVDDRRSTYSNFQQNLSADDRDRGSIQKPRYPHIKDLQARANATIRELSGFIPVCSGRYTSPRTRPRFRF